MFPAELLHQNLIPTLLTLDGREFLITDCMGVVDNFEGALPDKDKSGHPLNDRGYLVTKDGHICTRDGTVLF